MKYNFEGILGSAEAMSLQQKELDSHNSTLQTYVNALVASWDGAAKEAYQGTQADWTTSFTGLNDALSGIIKQVNAAAHDMSQLDKTLGGTWSH